MNVDKILRRISRHIDAIKADPRSGPALRNFHQMLQESGALFSFGVPSACVPGCANCCYRIPVVRSRVEERYIAKSIREKYALVRRRLEPVRQAQELWEETRREFGLRKTADKSYSFEAAWGDTNVACPMLDGKNLCLLYPKIPIECRMRSSPAPCRRGSAVAGNVFLPHEVTSLEEAVKLMERVESMDKPKEEWMDAGKELIRQLIEVCGKIDAWMALREPWEEKTIMEVVTNTLEDSATTSLPLGGSPVSLGPE